MGEIKLKLIRRIRRLLVWIWEQEGSCSQRSMGMAVGIFCGCFPLFGLQTFLGVLLATLFKVNRFWAVIGTWISNPFTYIPLYWLNYKVGSFFLGRVEMSADFDSSQTYEFLQHGWLFSLRLFLGSIIVGAISGLILGSALYFVLRNPSLLRFKIRR